MVQMEKGKTDWMQVLTYVRGDTACMSSGHSNVRNYVKAHTMQQRHESVTPAQYLSSAIGNLSSVMEAVPDGLYGTEGDYFWVLFA